MTTTPNASGSALGVVCDASGCVSFINPQIDCNEKSSYPALVSSPAGSASISLTCRHLGERRLYILSDISPLVDVMTIGGTIAIAFPMPNSEFSVSRFSLTGAARAYARIAQLAHASTSTGKARLGDSRL